ncbi:DAR GTPase 3, chloroplastic isoform X2 [Henckelia pumila]|uniref:DAR GTPase 3, chloroplastic isoform X2 n=1 Tax=Henckelia pumila TaxID=405737 RepID=UPI003C6DC9F4
MAATSLTTPRLDSSLSSPALQTLRFPIPFLPFPLASRNFPSPTSSPLNRRFSTAIRSESTNGAEPPPKYDFDLFTIGAGSGDVRESRFAANICELPFATISSDTTGSFGDTPLQIVGGNQLGWHEKESSKLGRTLESIHEDFDWVKLEADLCHWTRSLRPVQWYPGHIAKTEKELKEQLKLMDVVIEVRDARIPMSTSHPQMDSWLGNRKRIVVLNREDMISTADRNSWANYYARQGIKVVFSNGKLGMGTLKLNRLAKALAGGVNTKRKAKGLLPRPVRAGIIGYPNVGKSSLINRLLKRRLCNAAARPGVTRVLKWVRFGDDLELLDSPGMIPMRINDQSAAIKLAICDDIGERSYDVPEVAAILVQMLARLPTVGYEALHDRYKVEADSCVGKTFVQKLALRLFNGDSHQAAHRILSDFRKGKFGWVALERPPSCNLQDGNLQASPDEVPGIMGS